MRKMTSFSKVAKLATLQNGHFGANLKCNKHVENDSKLTLEVFYTKSR